MDVVRSYLELGLRLGRHVDGLVDAYYGPPELAAGVEAEPLRDAATLAADAEALLDALRGAGLDPHRQGWIADQAHGLRTYAGKLAGEAISYADEVERCYGVRPTVTPEAELERIHARLDELLPPGPSLLERYESWRATTFVPRDSILPLLEGVVAVFRERTRELYGLPEGELVTLEPVENEPWAAFNYYLGRLRSRVVFNVDHPIAAADLVHFAAHETFPGHHAEHAWKERRLIEELGWQEEGIQLVPTPQAVVSEGIAEVGPGLVLDDATSEAITAVVHGHGVAYDPASAEEIAEARRGIRSVGINVALAIHEPGMERAEAEAYLERWSLVTPSRAKQSVDFLTDPVWRAYPITYSEGRRLVEALVGTDTKAFGRLLTEQIRIGELVAAAA